MSTEVFTILSGMGIIAVKSKPVYVSLFHAGQNTRAIRVSGDGDEKRKYLHFIQPTTGGFVVPTSVAKQLKEGAVFSLLGKDYFVTSTRPCSRPAKHISISFVERINT